jgi:hypothetical protein
VAVVSFAFESCGRLCQNGPPSAGPYLFLSPLFVRQYSGSSPSQLNLQIQVMEDSSDVFVVTEKQKNLGNIQSFRNGQLGGLL